MSAVDDIQGVGRVVLQVERLQRPVVRGLAGHDVHGRLAHSIGDWELVDPLVGSWNETIIQKKMAMIEKKNPAASSFFDQVWMVGARSDMVMTRLPRLLSLVF